MGVDFSLACGECREFIDLHKWPIVEEAGAFLVDAHSPPGSYEGQRSPEDSPFPICDLETACKKIALASEQVIVAADEDEHSNDYIRKLKPAVRAFAEKHRGHRLFLVCDMGEEPWKTWVPGFADWLEVHGAFSFHRTLPRNLIEVEGIRSWDEVVKRFSDHWPFDYGDEEEIGMLKEAFEERLKLQGR